MSFLCMRQLKGHLSADFAAARTFTAVSPSAAGVTAVRTPFMISATDPFDPSDSDPFIHFLSSHKSFHGLVPGPAMGAHDCFPVTVPAEIKQPVARLARLGIICCALFVLCAFDLHLHFLLIFYPLFRVFLLRPDPFYIGCMFSGTTPFPEPLCVLLFSDAILHSFRSALREKKLRPKGSSICVKSS